MPLLGTPNFSLGSSAAAGDSTMGKSLDEMIQDRRKEQKMELKRGPKKATTADRSVATAKAKREAANKARRGLATDSKPTKMDVEKEVKRQSQSTQVQKKKKEQKQTQGRIAPDSTGRSAAKREKKKVAAKDPPAAVFGGRVPPKKAIEAAIKGMEDAGFKIPAGHQMVMTFAPIVVAPAASAAPATQKKPNANNNNNNNNNKGKNRGGGGGGPNRGGGGGGPNKKSGNAGGSKKN